MKTCIQSVEVIDVEKRRFPGKHYVYVISVTWTDGSINIIYRRYSTFDHLQSSLLELFPQEGGVINPEEQTLPVLPGKIIFGRSHVRDVALKRLNPLDNYCKLLTKLEPNISQCHAVLTFFQSTAEDIAAVTKTKTQDLKIISTPRLLEQYVAIYDFNKQSKDEIDVNAGDTLEVIEKYEDGWWLVNKNSEQGYVPGNYLKRSDSLKDSRTVAENCGEKYVCIEAFEPEGPDDHSLRVGVIVELIQKDLDGWWWVSINGKAGWAPATCLQLAEKNVQDRLDNLGSGTVETISNLSEVSNLLKGPITSVGDTHIISVGIDSEPKAPSCQIDYESDEFSDDNDDEDEGHYSCIIYAPAPKRRNTFKDMKTSSVKTKEKPENDIPEEETSASEQAEYLNIVDPLEPNSENVTSSVKEQEPDKNFNNELQLKLNRNLNAAGKYSCAMRPKSIPPPPPKRPDFMTPKKKIPQKAENGSEGNSVNPPKPIPHNNVPPPNSETVKVLPSAASESIFAGELQFKLNKLKNQQQVSKPESTAPKCNVKPSTGGKPLIPKEKPTVKNVTPPPPQPASLSLANARKQKSSSNFRHDNTESKVRETEPKEKDIVLSNVSKLSDKIAKFQNQSGIKDENPTPGNNRGLNLLKRQQEKHKFENSNLQDNKGETSSSSLKHITQRKQSGPAMPLKPPVPSKAALKPTVKCSQDSFPANADLKPKVPPPKPKFNQNVAHSNPHAAVSKSPLFPAQKTATVSNPSPVQVDRELNLQPQSSPKNNFVRKTAEDAEIKYQASCSYQAENAKEISFLCNDSIKVLEKDESGWWLVRVGTEEGWAPSNHIEEVKPMGNRKSEAPKKPLPKLTPGNQAKNTALHSNNNNSNYTSTSCRQNNSTNDNNRKDDKSRILGDCMYIILEDFSAFSDEELSVEEGAYVNVIDNSNNDWWYVSLDSGEEGWVPANCISTVHDV